MLSTGSDLMPVIWASRCKTQQYCHNCYILYLGSESGGGEGTRNKAVSNDGWNESNQAINISLNVYPSHPFHN